MLVPTGFYFHLSAVPNSKAFILGTRTHRTLTLTTLLPSLIPVKIIRIAPSFDGSRQSTSPAQFKDCLTYNLNSQPT
jgi:hypothetical protein